MIFTKIYLPDSGESGVIWWTLILLPYCSSQLSVSFQIIHSTKWLINVTGLVRWAPSRFLNEYIYVCLAKEGILMVEEEGILMLEISIYTWMHKILQSEIFNSSRSLLCFPCAECGHFSTSFNILIRSYNLTVSF